MLKYLKPCGEVTVQTEYGTYHAHNIKTNLHRAHYANWLAYDYPIDYATGSPSVGRYSIGVGLGTATAVSSDADLGNEIYRKAVSVRYVARSYIARLMTTFSTLEVPVPPGSSSVHITEYGLFDESPVSMNNSSFGSWSAGSPVGWLYSSVSVAAAGTPYLYEAGGSACKVTYGGGGTTSKIYQNITFDNDWKGKDITFRLAVKETTKANQSYLYLYDGVTYTTGTPHAGGAGTPYSILSVKKTLSGTAGTLQVGMIIRSGDTWIDWANTMPNGKLLARSTIDVYKGSTQPMNLTWDLYLDEVEVGEEMGYKAYAYEEINLGTVSAGSLGSAYYAPAGSATAEKVLVSVEGNTIRFRYDSGTPTTTSGHQSFAGDTFSLTDLTNIRQLRAISTSGSAYLKVTYEK